MRADVSENKEYGMRDILLVERAANWQHKSISYVQVFLILF